jgi:hypothetical protein
MNKAKNFSWQRVAIVTVLLSYFYVFIDWVFFATKPSFMSWQSLLSNIESYYITGGILALMGVVVLLILSAFSLLPAQLKIISRIPPNLARGCSAQLENSVWQ